MFSPRQRIAPSRPRSPALRLGRNAIVSAIFLLLACFGARAQSFTTSAEPHNSQNGNTSVAATSTPDFTNVASITPLTAFPGATVNFGGNLTALNGYASAVTLTCTAGSTAPP